MHIGGAQGFVVVVELVDVAAKGVYGWLGLMAGKMTDTLESCPSCGSNDEDRLLMGGLQACMTYPTPTLTPNLILLLLTPSPTVQLFDHREDNPTHLKNEGFAQDDRF